MNIDSRIKSQIKVLVEKHFSSQPESEFKLGSTRIPLIAPSFGAEEIIEAIDSMLTTQVTMGEKVNKFESMFAKYIGVKHALMVNSGSSANLIVLSALTNPLFRYRMKQGDEVITPAVTWATTVWPISNCNLVPVLVDVDMHTFNINVEEIEKAITDKTRAIMPVHLLGNPCNMKEIMRIAKKHKLFVIEDACEAHGAEFCEQKVGSFGDFSTFSFFFSHHIGTIEGGMVLTNDDNLADIARALRVFGWVRDVKNKDKIIAKYHDIDSRYLFYTTGYNFRPTEIQGAFGIHQIKKLDSFIKARQENAKFWSQHLSKYDKYLMLHDEQPNTKHVWFAYPITVRPEAPFTREDLTRFLEAKGVETRPIMAGNIVEQPAMRHLTYKQIGTLKNSRLIMRNSFFFGNHHKVTEQEREAILSYFKEFIAKFTKGTVIGGKSK